MKKEARLLRIGVLGCGPISQAAHFEACRRARNAELYAICDLAEDLVAGMAVIHEPRVTYQDYSAMLADPQVEAVIVATADQFHVEHASMALAAGKHVLVEKPLGVTVEECEALRKQVQASGLLLQVGTMKRFDPGIAFAHQFIKETMGQMLALKAWYCDSTYRYTMTNNLQPILLTSTHARRPVGDPKANKRRYYLLGHGSHLVDTARFLGGEIVRVEARLITDIGISLSCNGNLCDHSLYGFTRPRKHVALASRERIFPGLVRYAVLDGSRATHRRGGAGDVGL